MRRGVEACDLIAPRAVERVLGGRHQFDVREAHLHAVGGELFAELAVTEHTAAFFRDAAPGGQVHLVDRHRVGAQVAAATGFHPGSVVPDELRKIADDGGVVRRRLEMQAVRVRLQERRRVVRADNLVLVAGTGMDSGDEEFPDTGSPQIAHRVGVAVPEVMVADDRDAAGGGSPDGERDAQHAIEGADMGAQLIVGAVIVALTEQEEVVFRDRRQEAIRVVDEAAHAIGIRHAEAITEKHSARQFDLEDAAGMQLLHRDGLGRTVRDQFTGARPREERAGDQTSPDQRMQTQEAVRRGLLGVHQGGQLCWAEAHPRRLLAGQ